MSGEGLSKMFSPEWLRATATLIPVLLAMWWVLKGQGFLWRRSVWSAIGTDARALETQWGGTLRARWTGYELRTDTTRVRWHGGLRGEVTLVQHSGTTQRRDGWLGAEAIHRLISG